MVCSEALSSADASHSSSARVLRPAAVRSKRSRHRRVRQLRQAGGAGGIPARAGAAAQLRVSDARRRRSARRRQIDPVVRDGVLGRGDDAHASDLVPAGRRGRARGPRSASARRRRNVSRRRRRSASAITSARSTCCTAKATKNERDFLYADAMAALHARYPDDVDATAFYALALLGTAHEGRDFATYMRAASLLEEVFPAHLRHPGVLHYLIHSYDDPVHAPLGMRAARVYGAVAPDAGHALHMTSHIFIAMGMWDDVIDANRRAIARREPAARRASDAPAAIAVTIRRGCITGCCRRAGSTKRARRSMPAVRRRSRRRSSPAPTETAAVSARGVRDDARASDRQRQRVADARMRSPIPDGVERAGRAVHARVWRCARRRAAQRCGGAEDGGRRGCARCRRRAIDAIDEGTRCESDRAHHRAR